MNTRRTLRLAWRLAAFIVCICASSFARPSDHTSKAPQPGQPLTAQCVDLSLDHIDTEKVTFALKMSINASQELDLDQVTLANLRFNGLPVFAAPLEGPIHLIKGQQVDLPQPLLLTVYLRDVTSTKPISQALRDGFTALDGEIYLSVHLSTIAKIVLRSFQAIVPMKLQQRVPVAVPGGALAKSAALTVLEAADVALKHLLAGVSATEGIWPGLRHDILQQYAPETFAVLVSYSLSDASGKQVPLSWSGVAFRVSPTLLVLPQEALEPWSFDPDTTVAIQSGEYKLEPDTFRLSLWPAEQSAPSPLTTDGGLQLGKQLQDGTAKHQATTQIMLLNKSHLPQKGKLDVRANNNNIAFLQATDPLPAAPTPKTAPASAATQWETVALLRFPRLGSDKLTPEVILTSASLDHGRIRLGIKVDSTVFGSPIIAPDGIIGMVQDESTGVVWSAIAESMNPSK